MSRSSPAPGSVRPRNSDPSVAVAPVPGVSNSLLTRAIRRVEARWRELYGPSTDIADIPRILAASALAADRGDASFIDALSPRPSLRLSLHLVDLLEDELLAVWRSSEIAATQVLQTLSRLRVVRAAIERRFQQLPGAPLVGIDGLEFLIEFVHDMRSPLNSLLLLADRLQQGWSGPLTPLQLRQLRLIYAPAHALKTGPRQPLKIKRADDQPRQPVATALRSASPNVTGITSSSPWRIRALGFTRRRRRPCFNRSVAAWAPIARRFLPRGSVWRSRSVSLGRWAASSSTRPSPAKAPVSSSRFHSSPLDSFADQIGRASCRERV